MMIYLRFRGKSYEVAEHAVGIDGRLCDDEIRRRLARHLDVKAEELDEYVIDRMPGGDLIVRPVAVYG